MFNQLFTLNVICISIAFSAYTLVFTFLVVIEYQFDDLRHTPVIKEDFVFISALSYLIVEITVSYLKGT